MSCTHTPVVEVRHAVCAARRVHIAVQLQQRHLHARAPLGLQVLLRLPGTLRDQRELVRESRGGE